MSVCDTKEILDGSESNIHLLDDEKLYWMR